MISQLNLVKKIFTAAAKTKGRYSTAQSLSLPKGYKRPFNYIKNQQSRTDIDTENYFLVHYFVFIMHIISVKQGFHNNWLDTQVKFSISALFILFLLYVLSASKPASKLTK